MKWLLVLLLIYLLTNCCQADDIQLLLKLKSDPCGQGELYLEPNSTNGESAINSTEVVPDDPVVDFISIISEEPSIDGCDAIYQKTNQASPYSQTYLQTIDAKNFIQQLTTLTEIEKSYRYSNYSKSRFAYFTKSSTCDGAVRNFSTVYSTPISLENQEYSCTKVSYFFFLACLKTILEGSRTDVPKLMLYITADPTVPVSFYSHLASAYEKTGQFDKLEIRVLVLEARPRNTRSYNDTVAYYNQVESFSQWNISFIGSVWDSIQDIMSIIRAEVGKL